METGGNCRLALYALHASLLKARHWHTGMRVQMTFSNKTLSIYCRAYPGNLPYLDDIRLKKPRNSKTICTSRISYMYISAWFLPEYRSWGTNICPYMYGRLWTYPALPGKTSNGHSNRSSDPLPVLYGPCNVAKPYVVCYQQTTINVLCLLYSKGP